MSTSTDYNSDSNTQLAPIAPIEIPKFSKVRQDANPILAIHMLKEIHTMVTGWQRELQEIAQASLSITTSGTVLAAWLESRTFKRGSNGEAIPTPYETVDATDVETIDPQAGYRLCGLDEYGNLWTRPCQMSEILIVSRSIARYQQLKDLTDRKQKVEQCIRQVLEDLVHLRLKLQD
jgi:hypothetical protein